MNDDISIVFASFTVSGWTSVRITRGVERCPSDFEVELTERYPGEFATLTVVPGEPCVVMAGTDILITGYVDRYMPSIDSHSHSITIQGRGKCQDLVDCAAWIKGGQIQATGAYDIAVQLTHRFGIEVEKQAGLKTNIHNVGRFNLILGETPWEVIERVCGNVGVLCYEIPNGNLMLSHVGTETAASGFSEGVNVEQATYNLSSDQRYSEYTAFRMSFDGLQNQLPGGNFIASYADDGVKRYRPHFVIAEGGPGNFDMAQRKALWEKNRRIGRSYQVHLITDSWRDQAGQLYTPNTLAPVHIPTLKIVSQLWVIGEVTYHRDDHGTRAEIMLMPPGAFSPEPEILVPAFNLGAS